MKINGNTKLKTIAEGLRVMERRFCPGNGEHRPELTVRLTGFTHGGVNLYQKYSQLAMIPQYIYPCSARKTHVHTVYLLLGSNPRTLPAIWQPSCQTIDPKSKSGLSPDLRRYTRQQPGKDGPARFHQPGHHRGNYPQCGCMHENQSDIERSMGRVRTERKMQPGSLISTYCISIKRSSTFRNWRFPIPGSGSADLLLVPLNELSPRFMAPGLRQNDP